MRNPIPPSNKIIALCILILCLLSVVSNAQFKKDFGRLADKKFNQQNYDEAAQLYLRALSLDSKNDSIIAAIMPPDHKHAKKPAETDVPYLTYQLAESYRLDHNYKYAQLMYEKCIALKTTNFPLVRFWYAVCLKSNNQPEKAITQLNIFLQKHRENDGITKQAKIELASCNNMLDEKRHPIRTTVTKMPAPFNLQDNSFALQKIDNNTVLFSSARPDTVRKHKIMFPIKLYWGKLEENTTQLIDIKSKIDAAASSLSSDGLTLYFTSWKGHNANAIFYTTRATTTSEWRSPEMMSEPVNLKNAQSKHPFITADSKYLLFASDRQGGFGRFDIWMVNLSNGKVVGNAVNLGAGVNTAGEEASPYYDYIHSNLYFSSDSRDGLGGLDIYSAYGDLATNKWTETTNLGYPINSSRDELYYSRFAGSDTVYFSSNRESNSNILELFTAVEVPKTVETMAPPKDTVVTVIAAPVIVKIDTVKPVAPPMPSTTDNEFNRLIDSINTSTIARYTTKYEYNKTEPSEDDNSALDKIVKILKDNPDVNVLVASFADCKGSQAYNNRLTRARSRAVRAYFRKHGISSSRININFFGKKHFVLPCKDDSTYDKEKQAANRRSDIILTKEKNPKWHPSGKETDARDMIERIKHGRSFDDESNNSNSSSHKEKVATKRAEKVKKERTRKNKMQAQLNSTATDKYGNLKNETTYMSPSISKGMHDNMSVLDSVERFNKKKSTIDEMLSRIAKQPILLYTNSDSVHVELYDNGVFDYDSISVIYNKQVVVHDQLLKVDNPISFFAKVDKDESKNIMVFYADNLGLIPPNSALMVITDGDGKRTEVSITNDLQHNTVIYFIKQKKN